MTHDRSTTVTCSPSVAWLSVVLRKIKFEHRSGANFLLLMFQRAMEVCFFTASILRNPYLDFFMTQERGKMKKILIIIIKMTKSGTIIILSCTFWQGEIMFRPDINALRTHVVVSRCDLVWQPGSGLFTWLVTPVTESCFAARLLPCCSSRPKVFVRMSSSREQIVPIEEEDRDSLECSQDSLKEKTTVTAIGKVNHIRNCQ